MIALDHDHGAHLTRSYPQPHQGGLPDSFIPLSIFLVFFSILGIAGSLDAMVDIAAVAEDAVKRSEDGWPALRQYRVDAVQVLIALGFGLTAIAELWVMWS